MREISFSRPMTGSSLPSRACAVRFVPNWVSVLAFASSARADSPEKNGRPAPGRPDAEPAMGRLRPWSFDVSLSTAPRTAAADTPRRWRMSMPMPSPSSTTPSSRCSVDT